MSGASIPYHLRPHKAVDRRLFLDLLSRFERWMPLQDYTYLSMGAYPLVDHKLVHRIIGITNLVAFDLDDEVVARQRFNRPIETCHCIKKTSGQLIADLDGILVGCGFQPDKGVIVWLDYTDPSKIGEQIREFQSLVGKLKRGDVVRVTVNAHPQALGDSRQADGTLVAADVMRVRRLQKLKDRIGDFLPSGVLPEQVSAVELPKLLAAAFASAAAQALPAHGENVFLPLSIVRYADGQQMLSITGTVVTRGEQASVINTLSLPAWPFASLAWNTVHELVVPDLTVRERLFLERGVMTTSASQLIEDLGFQTAADLKIEDFLQNYRNYYRFYPTLLTAEL